MANMLNEALDKLALTAQGLAGRAQQVNLFIQAVQNRIVAAKFHIPVWIAFSEGELGFDKTFAVNDWRLVVKFKSSETDENQRDLVDLLSAPIKVRAAAAVVLPELVTAILHQAIELEALLAKMPPLDGLISRTESSEPVRQTMAQGMVSVAEPPASKAKTEESRPVPASTVKVRRFGTCAEEGRGPAPRPEPETMSNPDAQHELHETGGRGIPVPPKPYPR